MPSTSIYGPLDMHLLFEKHPLRLILLRFVHPHLLIPLPSGLMHKGMMNLQRPATTCTGNRYPRGMALGHIPMNSWMAAFRGSQFPCLLFRGRTRDTWSTTGPLHSSLNPLSASPPTLALVSSPMPCVASTCATTTLAAGDKLESGMEQDRTTCKPLPGKRGRPVG